MELKDESHAKSLEAERLENQKLYDLLRQAEKEMEICTVQINEMSEAMATHKENEAEAVGKSKATETRLMQLQDDFETFRSGSMEQSEHLKGSIADKNRQLQEKESLLLEVKSRRDELQTKLDDAAAKFMSKDNEVKSMKLSMESLEKKTARLREYVRKLTTKCEEWEESYEKQSESLERLQAKNTAIRCKASQITEKYKRLADHVQRRKRMHKEDRAKWSSERYNLNHVHLQLEQELEQIAKELSLPVENMEH